MNRAIIFYKIGLYDNALSDLLKASQLLGDKTDIFIELGKVYSAKNDKLKAIDYFTKAVSLNPSNPESFNMRGKEYYGVVAKV